MPRPAPPSAARRTARWPLALALGCPAALAAAVDSMAPLPVGDLSLTPGGDLRDEAQRFEFHPKVLLGVGWNSDPLPGRDGESDADEYLRSLVGILVRYHPQPGLDGQIDGEIERIDYRRDSVLDTDAGLLRLQGDYVAPLLSVRGELGWRRYQDAIVSTGDEVARDLDQVLISAKHDSARLWEDGTAEVSYLDYRQATSEFDEREGDNLTLDLGGRVGVITGPDRHFASLRLQAVRYATDRRFNDCDAFTLTVGSLISPALRTNFAAEAGIETRRYRDDFLHDPRNDDRTATAPWLDLHGVWSWREGNHLGAGVYSDLADGITSNAVWSLGIRADALVAITARLTANAATDLSQERDGGLGSATQRRIRQGSFAGQYALAEGLALRAKAVASAVETADGGGYHRLVLSLDLAWAY